MTKQTKYILLGILGATLAGGVLVVATIAIIGISILAAAHSDEAPGKNKPSTTRSSSNNSKQTKKSGDDSKNTEISDDDAEEVSGSLAPELVGKWYRSEGSSNVDFTGKTQYKAYADYTYEFAADGTVKYLMKTDVLTVMQCKMNETKSAVGKAAADGETLTISLGKTNHTSSSSCESADNFEKTLPAETTKLQYRMKTEYEETQLCIEEAEGEKCYQRK